MPLINLWSLNGPAMQSLMVSCVDPSAQGQLQGALQSLRGLCKLVTPLLFTQVFVLGTPLLAGAPYWLAAALVGAALLLAMRVARPPREPERPHGSPALRSLAMISSRPPTAAMRVAACSAVSSGLMPRTSPTSVCASASRPCET